jgi:hypothetical protein
MVISIDMVKLSKLQITVGEYALLYLLANRLIATAKHLLELDSSITPETIQKLVKKKLIHAAKQGDTIDITKIVVRSAFLDEIKKGDMFDELVAHYPIKVTRPDGMVDYLRNDLTRCRKLYNQTIKGGEAEHKEIIDALKYEIYDRTNSNKMGYMKRLHKWLTSEEWQVWQQKLKEVNMIDRADYFSTLGYGLKLE